MCTSTSRKLLLKTNYCSTSYGKYQVLVNRYVSSRTKAEAQKKGVKTTLVYIGAAGVFMLGMTYAGVPLYRIFCKVNICICTIKMSSNGLILFFKEFFEKYITSMINFYVNFSDFEMKLKHRCENVIVIINGGVSWN